MAARTPQALAHDLTEVVDFFNERGILPAPVPAALMTPIRKIHKHTYSLILWRFRIKKIPQCGKVFLDEVASDAIQILPQALMGYKKAVSLHLRGVVENVLRHVYFSDHQIEFVRMNADPKWFLPVQELFDYARHHPDLSTVEKEYKALDRLSSVFDALSSDVHGRKVTNLEMRVALEAINRDLPTLTRQAELVRSTSEAANFILAVFHWNRVRSFTPRDQQIVFGAMSKQGRRVWRGVE